MGLTNEHVGPKILAKIKIYVLTRAELLFTLCYEIPCTFKKEQFPWKLYAEIRQVFLEPRRLAVKNYLLCAKKIFIVYLHMIGIRNFKPTISSIFHFDRVNDSCISHISFRQFLQISFIYFQKTSVDLEEDWDDIKIYDDNPKVQAQIEDLSTENKSLAREVAFLKETIKVRDHPLMCPIFFV